MRGDHYDHRADVFSFGICLVAMMRAERNIIEFFFECLRKTMKRPKGNRKGVGMAILNHRILNKDWRPAVPVVFRKSYPKLSKLVERCWQRDHTSRPDFAEIIGLLQGPINTEILAADEPKMVM
jgi:hypothetical protein